MSVSERVHQVPDRALGNTSYLVDAGDGTAFVVDPRREAAEYVALADRLDLRIVAAVETHLHADFVTGTRELADATAAQVLASRGAELAFPHAPLDDGRGRRIGAIELEVIATPGHTPEHLSFLVRDADGSVALLSGGALIVGGAARTDLIDESQTEPLSRALFATIRRLAELPDETILYPTHGAGSFCSTGLARERTSTLGRERAGNPLMRIDDEDAFVRELRAGFGSYPSYFLRLRAVNRAGPTLVRELGEPPTLRPEVARTLLGAGAWLVDGRTVEQWAAAHPPGAVSISVRSAFASWLGWVVPLGEPILLLVDPEQRAEAVRLARRIGHDRIVGVLEGVEEWRDQSMPLESVELVDPEEAARRPDAVFLDVRQDHEWKRDRIAGSIHLELGDVIAGAAPDVTSVVTYCGHGERSATAASLLARRGTRVANLRGGLDAWREAGLPVTS